MLQRVERFNIVENGRFSTGNVENILRVKRLNPLRQRVIGIDAKNRG